MRICAFLGSSIGLSPRYARRGIGLVYGSGSIGLMGLVADGACAGGGEVTGIIPEVPGPCPSQPVPRRLHHARAQGADGGTVRRLRGPARRHRLALYRGRRAVVLSTDDEGVSRSDMTHEYLRAATEEGLRYADLKVMARASLKYAFLQGASLWQDGRVGLPPGPGGCVRSHRRVRRIHRGQRKSRRALATRG